MSVIQKASLVLIPSGYKDSVLYSQVPNTTAGDFEFSRASTGTRVGSDGYIEDVATNVPRLDYTDSSCPTLLLEGQRTNELKYSEDYSQSYWRKDKLTVTANSATSPSGLTDAFLIQETTYTNSIPSFDLQNSNTLSAGTYTFSFYVKNNSGRYLGISFGSSGERVRTNFDFNTNTFKTLNLSGSTTGSASYTTLGDYYRISITATFPSSTAVDNVLMPLETDTYPFFAFQDSDNRSFYLWGMQVEQGSFATSYIPTSGTSVTRVKDFFEADSLGSIIGQTEGCIFIDFVYLDGERFYIYDAANTANGFLIYRSGTGYNLQVTTSGGGWAITNFITGLTIGTRYKLAINYKLNDYKICVNGSQVATSTSIEVPTTNKISSWGLYGTTDFKNKINQFIMFNEALTDSELIELTGGTATTYNWIDNDSNEIITSDGDNLIFT